MHETVPTARVSGQVFFHDQDIYGDDVNPITLRRHVGMVFQRPTPFPTMSIRDNVAAGLRVPPGDKPGRKQGGEDVERAPRQGGPWGEGEDRPKNSPPRISGGQPQPPWHP